MNHRRASLAVFMTVSFAAVAQAGDRHSWFEGLKMPGTAISCCDISDCRRTDADWRGGQWWATVNGMWTPIPPAKELTKRSIDGDAYVCAGPNRTVYCFVRPDMAM
jgi:hypothetical protein